MLEMIPAETHRVVLGFTLIAESAAVTWALHINCSVKAAKMNLSGVSGCSLKEVIKKTTHKQYKQKLKLQKQPGVC